MLSTSPKLRRTLNKTLDQVAVMGITKKLAGVKILPVKMRNQMTFFNLNKNEW